jgi:alkanesulfonate monooxygenase SsuD/methylene tetrahydromethanopterin reductase-like flavin-dependent oxidoreductase (luciferase family)
MTACGAPAILLDASDCIIFGSPERCVQRLKRAQEDYGLTYVIFEVNFGGLPHAKVLQSLERFAKEVMPHVS